MAQQRRRLESPAKVRVGRNKYGWVCVVNARRTLRKRGPNAKVILWTTEAGNTRVGQVSLTVIRQQLGI